MISIMMTLASAGESLCGPMLRLPTVAKLCRTHCDINTIEETYMAQGPVVGQLHVIFREI